MSNAQVMFIVGSIFIVQKDSKSLYFGCFLWVGAAFTSFMAHFG